MWVNITDRADIWKLLRDFGFLPFDFDPEELARRRIEEALRSIGGFIRVELTDKKDGAMIHRSNYSSSYDISRIAKYVFRNLSILPTSIYYKLNKIVLPSSDPIASRSGIKNSSGNDDGSTCDSVGDFFYDLSKRKNRSHYDAIDPSIIFKDKDCVYVQISASDPSGSETLPTQHHHSRRASCDGDRLQGKLSGATREPIPALSTTV